MIKRKVKISSLYDTLVWVLLIWCVLQDFVLAALLQVFGAVGLVKMLFISKDVMLLLLFVFAAIRVKIPRIMAACLAIYCCLVFVQTGATIVSHSGAYSVTSILSSIRGLILLPTLTIVGMAVKNKVVFFDNTKKYYRFLVVIALFGLIEFAADFVFGTKDFWMDTLKLNDYYTVIKGQPALIENGTPGNWYTDIGGGYRTQKRLISIWAAPLTAGFVLLPPSLYYMMRLFSKRKQQPTLLNKSHILCTEKAVVCGIALVLTFTRQTILPYLLLLFSSFIYYNKKNRAILIVCSCLIILIVCSALTGTIIDYLYNGSTKVHIMQISQALSQISVFGSGVASFGTRFSGSIGTESQYITIIGQLGVIGLPLYMFLLLYPIMRCRKWIHRLDKETRVLLSSICFSGITYALAGIVSETVAAFTSIAQYYVLIGVSWGICMDHKKEILKFENTYYCNVSSPVPSDT